MSTISVAAAARHDILTKIPKVSSCTKFLISPHSVPVALSVMRDVSRFIQTRWAQNGGIPADFGYAPDLIGGADLP